MESLLPPAVAVMVAVPLPKPVTLPEVVTEATDKLSLFQLIAAELFAGLSTVVRVLLEPLSK